MTDETIVAFYDIEIHAEAAIADLIKAGIPQSDITRHAGTRPSGTGTRMAAGSPAHEQGFWANLFGGEPDHDTAVYDRSVERGATVVTVKVPEAHVAPVMDILESHDPIDLEEHATGNAGPATAREMAPTAPGAGETISLAEESLVVGKRLVNRGGTRIRRFVVETPVEQNVSLRSEKVVLERRPVTDDRPASDAGFTDKTIEMVESTEEPVVSKSAHVVEEVRLRKEATDRVETIRDTVRKQQVAVDEIPGAPKV